MNLFVLNAYYSINVCGCEQHLRQFTEDNDQLVGHLGDRSRHLHLLNSSINAFYFSVHSALKILFYLEHANA